MATTLLIIELLIVLGCIFLGARTGGIGLGIFGMLGTFILVYGFGLEPGKTPVDVMLIILAVITASAALQATGGLDYLVGLTAKFLKKHPEHITFYGPLCTFAFCVLQAPPIPVTLSYRLSVKLHKQTRYAPSVR